MRQRPKPLSCEQGARQSCRLLGNVLAGNPSVSDEISQSLTDFTCPDLGSSSQALIMQEHLYASSAAQCWRSCLYAPNTGPSSSTRAFRMTGLSLRVKDHIFVGGPAPFKPSLSVQGLLQGYMCAMPLSATGQQLPLRYTKLRIVIVAG